jgi:hypothetical protein
LIHVIRKEVGLPLACLVSLHIKLCCLFVR